MEQNPRPLPERHDPALHSQLAGHPGAMEGEHRAGASQHVTGVAGWSVPASTTSQADMGVVSPLVGIPTETT